MPADFMTKPQTKDLFQLLTGNQSRECKKNTPRMVRRKEHWDTKAFRHFRKLMARYTQNSNHQKIRKNKSEEGDKITES